MRSSTTTWQRPLRVFPRCPSGPPWLVNGLSDCRRRVIRAAARKSRRDGRLAVPLAGGPELPRVASDGASDWANKPREQLLRLSRTKHRHTQRVWNDRPRAIQSLDLSPRSARAVSRPPRQRLLSPGSRDDGTIPAFTDLTLPRRNLLSKWRIPELATTPEARTSSSSIRLSQPDMLQSLLRVVCTCVTTLQRGSSR